MQLRRSTHIAAAFLAFAFAWSLSVSVATAQAQDGTDEQPAVACGTDAYLASLPVPAPQGSGIKRQVQLVNCSDQVLLGAATAAHDAGKPPYPVFPQAVAPAKVGTWVMQPFNPNDPTNYSNVLTVDIPPEWYGQFKKGGVGAVFWARTGCHYDAVTNRAQCETGSCADQYDCSSAEISPPNATTIIEWTFYQQFGQYFIDSPDISAVNGANLTVDVSPKGSSEFDPRSETNWHWLEWNYPLTVHGADLREAANCTTSSAGSFKVFRADIDKTKGSKPGYPKLGYVVVDSNGMPTLPAYNFALACLSNCGKYKFPEELGYPKCNPKTDSNCYFWDTFCAGDIGIKYGNDCKTGKGPNGSACDTDTDCLKCNPGTDYHIACFHNSGPNKLGRCDLRGFLNGTVSACNGVPDPQPAAPTSTVACTNTYGSINPLAKNEADKFDWNDQPILGKCTDVIFVGNGKKAACIGEDTLHKVLHGAYTWPNDPQVYAGDAPVYRIVFSPEGRGKANITPAQPSIPLCSATTTFPDNYKYSQNRGNCGISVNNQGAVFGIGVVRNQPPNQWYSSGSDWPCNPDQRSDASQGVLCRWNPPPADHCSLADDGNCNCTPPTTDDQYVTNSACGRIDSDTSLVSGSITPNNGDPLFVEVSIPKVQNPANAPVSLSGCAPAWSLVASKALPTNLGIVAWYKGTSNNNVACNVTVTMANKNPAELKVYDVPKFNGTIETTSSATGSYNGGGSFAFVSAGTATTAFSSDLQLGGLLMVDQVPAPITYWTNWLTNGPNQLQCLMRDLNCPKDDGPDYLPGHGPFSSNSDVGHNNVTPGTQYFHRDGFNLGQYSWVGVAIYPELNQ